MDPELIGRAVLKGLLDGVTAQAVNLVNAHLVARERGLEVVVRTDEEAASGYTNLITVTTQAGDGRKIIAGTVFDGVPRIVRLRGPAHRVHSRGAYPGAVLRGPARHGGQDRLHPGPPQRQHRLDARGPAHQARGRAIVVLLLDEDVPHGGHGGGGKAVEADFARVIRL